MTLECIRLGTGRVTLQTITQQNAGGDTMIGEFAKQTIMENYIVHKHSLHDLLTNSLLLFQA
jgi:hypothetical protein